MRTILLLALVVSSSIFADEGTENKGIQWKNIYSNYKYVLPCIAGYAASFALASDNKFAIGSTVCGANMVTQLVFDDAFKQEQAINNKVFFEKAIEDNKFETARLFKEQQDKYEQYKLVIREVIIRKIKGLDESVKSKIEKKLKGKKFEEFMDKKMKGLMEEELNKENGSISKKIKKKADAVIGKIVKLLEVKYSTKREDLQKDTQVKVETIKITPPTAEKTKINIKKQELTKQQKTPEKTKTIVIDTSIAK